MLPLFYVIGGLNQEMVYNNTSQMLFDAAIVLAGAIVVFALAVCLFKWREDLIGRKSPLSCVSQSAQSLPVVDLFAKYSVMKGRDEHDRSKNQS